MGRQGRYPIFARMFSCPTYTSLMLPNYRWDAPWSSTVYVGPLVVGSNKTLV
jgi:hypothetical protein